MNVIAFRPRPGAEQPTPPEGQTVLTGTFRSPQGRSGQMTGSLRLQRLLLVPRGAFVTGVFTGELREPDGTLIGVDSRRATVPADLVRGEQGLRPVVRPLTIDLMGITVNVRGFVVEPALGLAQRGGPTRASHRAAAARGTRGRPA